MKKPTFIVVCAILFIFLDSCKQDKKEDQALKESAPQNYESIKPMRIPKNVENLVAYVSLKDSVLYVANEEKF